MKVLYALILFLPLKANAGWYCNQVASAWLEEGRILSTCGIGYGKDEEEARVNAFESAKREFRSVCSEATSCANKVFNIDPQKSECSFDGKFTCRRLFYFHISNDVAPKKDVPPPKVIIRTVEIPTPVPVTTVVEVPTTHNINNIQNHYTIIQQPQAPRGVLAFPKFRQFIRSVGPVKIYSTNSREYHGVYLFNPSESDIETAIIRSSKSGRSDNIYIYSN